MDVLLLGTAAVVLIAITLWIIWQPSPTAEGPRAATLPPQGNQFEDQYTSATADLSAAGVALSSATTYEAEPPTIAEPVGRLEPVQQALESTIVEVPTTTEQGHPGLLTASLETELSTSTRAGPARTVGLGAAALLTLGGAVGGAWLYSRWMRERNRPINQLRRRFR
jgi:hypothetical protein